MALKDLTVAKSELTEKQVEAIVANYVRYDPTAKEVVLLPAASSLPNRRKVLVYLVALQGWPFVTGDPGPTEATPASIGQVLHISGGTLRPVLKELKDSHFISARGRSYSVRAAALPHIKDEISTGASGVRRTGHTSKPRRTSVASDKMPTRAEKRTTRKKSTTPVGEKSAFFDKLISGGFFDKPRVLKEIVGRFHEKGYIVPRTSMPRYLLKAIRPQDGRLTRERREFDGKKVWVYQKAK